jgi:hypothetical protein
MNIFDSYSAAELREIFRDPITAWPEDFREFVEGQIASDLLENWVEQATTEEYRDRVRDIVESFTYGYEDEDGNELLDFNPIVENDGQIRLFE